MRVRLTKAQREEERQIHLEELHRIAPDIADEYEDANLSLLRAIHAAQYGYGPIARAQARLRREAEMEERRREQLRPQPFEIFE